jgi:uncharacterized protein (DUF697 family)
MSKVSKIEQFAKELKLILNNVTEDPSIPYDKKINIIIHLASLTCAIIAIQPIPFADLFVLTPIQVVMVIFLSKVIGNPIGNNGAKEIVTYIIGVVGYGVLAQQVVLGLYKTVLPFMGAITSMPLVYAATYGLGISAKTILEARLKDQNISKEKLKKISQEASKQAKNQKRDWRPEALINEFEEYKRKAKEYEQYKHVLEKQTKELFELKQMNSFLENQLNELEGKLRNSVSEDEWMTILQEQELEHEKLKSELREFQNIKKELEKAQSQLSSLSTKRMDLLKGRFSRLYPNIHISDKIIKEISLFSSQRLHALEAQIALLQHSPNKVNYRDKIHGTNILEIGFDGDGRMYVKREGNMTTIYRIGDKRTQKQDIEWLKSKAV